VNKIALSVDDDKREICDNKIETFAHGHFTTTTTVHDVWTKNRNTHGQTKGPWEQGPKPWKSAYDVINCTWYAWLKKWAFLSGEYNKQTKKRAGPLNPQFPTSPPYWKLSGDGSGTYRHGRNYVGDTREVSVNRVHEFVKISLKVHRNEKGWRAGL